MKAPLTAVLVGHTNVGKTSTLRTLMRDRGFGDVANLPGTTREVQGRHFGGEVRPAIHFLDTPGFSDAGGLLEHLAEMRSGLSPAERVRAFLGGPEAAEHFAAEARILGQVMASDVAVLVIDTRELGLPKFQSEIELLVACGNPVLPLLNFCTDPHSRRQEWIEMLAALGLHSHVEFDAVGPAPDTEQQFYLSLGALLPRQRAGLQVLSEELVRERAARRRESLRLIASLLLELAAMTKQVPREEIDDNQKYRRLSESFRHDLAIRSSKTERDLFDLHGFGRPALAAHAVHGSIIQWKSQVIDTILNFQRMVAVTATDRALGLVTSQQLGLLLALERRGHAAPDERKVLGSVQLHTYYLAAVVRACETARDNPGWSGPRDLSSKEAARLRQCRDDLIDALECGIEGLR